MWKIKHYNKLFNCTEILSLDMKLYLSYNNFTELIRGNKVLIGDDTYKLVYIPILKEILK